jgi:imidazolonepropionase-like amidohydrolase
MKLKNCICLGVLTILASCSPDLSKWQDISEEGSFLVYRRQSLIGEEKYTINSNKDSIVVRSIQGENERGRITGDEAELHLKMDLTPTFYENKRLTSNDTINNLKVKVTSNNVDIWELDHELVTVSSSIFFPLHSEIPAAMEMMLYHFYFDNIKTGNVTILPRGEVSISFKKKDTVEIKGNKIILDRYVVEGINWGGRTVWLDGSKNLVAVVKANTQIREMIRKGYEDALPTFIAGNVEEEIEALKKYTKELKEEQAEIKALVGGDLVDGLSDETKKDMTLIIQNGKIITIGTRSETKIPDNAQIIDVSGKTIIPGLWDMHAHSNQVQWGPAYLAGGITTIRDNGNEIEFATAFRDAIENGAMGPDILLSGMTDGAGIQGNGIIRATTPDEARDVVNMYFEKGYKQIKIYNSIQPNILRVLTEEAHKRGMTVTGHVPKAVGNARNAIELGMDALSHRSLILSVLFPDKNINDLGRYYLEDNEPSEDQIKDATQFLLNNKTALDPTIALEVTGSLTKGTPIETVEPDAYRIAYELFDGKRFKRSVNPVRSKKIKNEISKSMEIIGGFYHAGIPIVAGTDNAVPVFSLYLELETYQKLGNLTPLEALKTATIIPAKVMGLDNETGTLELGKQADIAILDKNPLEDISNIRTVSAVITNGNYYMSKPLWHAADFKSKND